jgi:hypothetical protein
LTLKILKLRLVEEPRAALREGCIELEECTQASSTERLFAVVGTRTQE